VQVVGIPTDAYFAMEEIKNVWGESCFCKKGTGEILFSGTVVTWGVGIAYVVSLMFRTAFFMMN
jgi:hypothetical protein